MTSATATAEVTATSEATEATESEDAAATSDERAASIDSLLAGRTGRYHVVVIGPGDAAPYQVNADEQVQAASLYKLLIMVEVFQQIEDGRIALDDNVQMNAGFFIEAGYDDTFDTSYIGSTVTVEELIRPMVGLSSNVAAFALLDLVGNWNINATVAALGMNASEIRWMPRLSAMDSGAEPPALASWASVEPTEPLAPTADEAFNVTSAADIALLFRLLIAGEVVSPEASATMLDLLSGQVVNNRLPAKLPADVQVAHKTGNIDNVVHDAGVIFAPAGPVVVVVLTADAIEWEAIEFMQDLALLVYEQAAG